MLQALDSRATTFTATDYPSGVVMTTMPDRTRGCVVRRHEGRRRRSDYLENSL